MPAEDDLVEAAQAIDRALRSIRHELRRPVESELHRRPLTSPQMRAMAVLAQPENLNGMALKDLTLAMGLSQSTGSGIVDRLQRMGLLKRQPDENDRRLTRIVVTEGVKQYLQKDLVEQRLGVLLQALERASPAEREMIRGGVETLARLLVLK